MSESRVLKDLTSVGPATIRDFEALGITSVDQLADKDAIKLFCQLESLKGVRIDPCVEDVFRCAIEQARNPRLSKEKRNWFYWSKIRKRRSNKN